MAVMFRAVVMLVTLVGLPTAWVYYGPLPQEAQQVVDRFVEVAQDALGWKKSLPANTTSGEKTAPRYEDVLPTPIERPAVSRATFQGSVAPVKLASATEEMSIPAEPIAQDKQGEMAMHLSLLKSLGVAQYSLEKWGQGYRFKCAIPLSDNPDFTRQFEAIDTDPLASVRQVVGEVTAMQNARHDTGTLWR